MKPSLAEVHVLRVHDGFAVGTFEDRSDASPIHVSMHEHLDQALHQAMREADLAGLDKIICQI